VVGDLGERFDACGPLLGARLRLYALPISIQPLAGRFYACCSRRTGVGGYLRSGRPLWRVVSRGRRVFRLLPHTRCTVTRIGGA
jgi:hypothetical protein